MHYRINVPHQKEEINTFLRIVFITIVIACMYANYYTV